MQHQISRRALMKSALLAGVLVPSLARAADPPVDENEPPAKAFGFVKDAAQVNASAQPTFKAGQRCAGCSQYQGKATDAVAGCSIFGGRTVPGGGWCKVWSARSA